MKRIFLSHSSKDKIFYIENIVKNLTKLIGKDKFVYDAITFEEGQETSQEISKWLKNTEIFVLFISETALESPWVKKEILEAKDLFDRNDLRKIYPIIIDEQITHEDKRIPNWMRETYNIRIISRPAVAARKIHNRYIELVWEKNPKIKEKNTFFVGRNSLIDNIEERIDTYDKPVPTSLIASGLNEIGRRSLLRRSLIKSSIISESYFMPTIFLDAHQSIEDLILLLNDLGFESDYGFEKSLMQISQDEKIEIAFKMFKEMKNAKDVLLIVDEGAIVSPTRTISDWYLKLNNKLNEAFNGMTICVVSKHRTRFQDLIKAESIHAVHVPELSAGERSRLFTRYSRISGLDLGDEDIKYVTTFFSGLPKEIIYTADYIKHNNIQDIKRDTSIITDFSDGKVSRLVSQYDKNANAHNLLALIATFDFISYSMLSELFNDSEEYKMLIEDFITNGICENLGINGEYICLNSAIKNYVKRQRFEMGKEFKDALHEHVKNFMNDYDNFNDKDVSDVFYSLREVISENKEIDNRYLIPSHYLKSMKELYDRKDRDQDVVKLADRILISEEFMDRHIAREIRYFLCSSLARLKDDRFKAEVQKIDGPEHNFLFGFYYRHVGRDREAINSLLKALEERPKFSRAKRELVLVYNNNEEYDKALNLAQENYEFNKNNEFHIQAYFQCLSYGRSDNLSFEERRNRASLLLEDIDKIDSEKAKSMSLVMNIQYNVYFNDNFEIAQDLIEKNAFLYPNDIFVLLATFDFYEKVGSIEHLRSILEAIKNIHGNTWSKYNRDYVKCLAVYKAANGDILKARAIARDINTSETAKRILENKINRYETASRD
ncbi:toll/interleukin-1 receptor domain-containing protein [Halalkalibacter okhensis]|uniref:toll/interleukin-1 receptor domain-containing protein n=1 Tax=Halalkalibacter okhensis TaxID=333138 RepID=UPI00068A86E8|nr:toll/interleukin-1 receptor domain-containing protein [Halalkalibacter okhensis]